MSRQSFMENLCMLLEEENAEPHIIEAFNILKEGLIDFLKDTQSHFSYIGVDFLEATISKILFAKSNLEDESNMEKLVTMEEYIWESIRNQFSEDYSNFISEGNTLPNDISSARFIFYFFYYNRKTNISSAVTNYIISNRKDIAKNASDPESIVWLKKEFPGFVNESYYRVINEISDVTERFVTDYGSFESIMNSVPMNFRNAEFINNLFGDCDKQSLFSKYMEGFIESEYLHNNTNEIKKNVIEILKNLE